MNEQGSALCLNAAKVPISKALSLDFSSPPVLDMMICYCVTNKYSCSFNSLSDVDHWGWDIQNVVSTFVLLVKYLEQEATAFGREVAREDILSQSWSWKQRVIQTKSGGVDNCHRLVWQCGSVTPWSMCLMFWDPHWSVCRKAIFHPRMCFNWYTIWVNVHDTLHYNPRWI